jgi:hypothetical protein
MILTANLLGLPASTAGGPTTTAELTDADTTARTPYVKTLRTISFASLDKKADFFQARSSPLNGFDVFLTTIEIYMCGEKASLRTRRTRRRLYLHYCGTESWCKQVVERMAATIRGQAEMTRQDDCNAARGTLHPLAT